MHHHFVNKGYIIMINKLLLPCVLFTVLLSGCKNPFESKSNGVERLNDIEARWSDAIDIASSTARIALPTPIANLQDIKRELGTVELSDCLKPAQNALNDYMNINIGAFLQFMANQEPTKLKSDEKLIEYFSIKQKCIGDKATFKSKLEIEAQVAQDILKARAASQEALVKAAKEKGISVEELTAASEALAAAEEAKILAEQAASEAIAITKEIEALNQ